MTLSRSGRRPFGRVRDETAHSHPLPPDGFWIIVPAKPPQGSARIIHEIPETPSPGTPWVPSPIEGEGHIL